MIKLELPGPKAGTEDPLWTRWREDCEARQRALIRYHEHEGEPVEIDPDLYGRDSIMKRFYRGDPGGERIAPFYGKCVYCEYTKFLLHIEHFRPKKGVTDAPAQVSPDGTKRAHPGYYWLAYEVDNLLLACDDCNVFFKKEQFPLGDESARAWASTDVLEKEVPLLLNPFVDDPSEHLGVDLKTGILLHKTERGRWTRELLRLNRDSLVELRLNMITRIHQEWTRWLAADSTDEQRYRAGDYLKKCRRGCSRFTMTAKLLIDQLHERTRALADLG